MSSRDHPEGGRYREKCSVLRECSVAGISESRHLGAAIRREMFEDEIDTLFGQSRSNGGSNLSSGLRRVREGRVRFRLKRKYSGGGFFPSFDAWLVIRVDVNQRSVEADRAFKQRDQRTDRPRVDASHRDGHRLAFVAVKRLACADEEAVQIVSSRDAWLDFHRRAA